MHMQQVKARSLFLNYSTFDLVRTKLHLYLELRGLVVHALLVFFLNIILKAIDLTHFAVKWYFHIHCLIKMQG